VESLLFKGLERDRVGWKKAEGFLRITHLPPLRFQVPSANL